MKTIHYRVILKEPAILTAVEGEPNSAVSYDFIPGAVMRGFFIGQYKIRDLDPTDEATGRLFFSNRTRYLNLYPVVNDRRSLPVPVSWRKKKYRLSEEDDKAIYDEVFSRGERDTPYKMSNISGFVDYDPELGQANRYKPERILSIHTQRARRSPDEQQVYRYDALAPGQSFGGMILCEHDEDIATLLGLMQNKQQIHIGGARSAGYGLAEIEIQEDWVTDEWWEVAHQPGLTIVLTLLSDVILRNHLGQYSPTPDTLKQAFSRHGITFDYGDYIAAQTTFVGGFNRKWGLPLTQTLALKRGSVVTLENVHASEDALWSLLWNGLGERTNEGFGQIASNWQRSAMIHTEQLEKPLIQPKEQPETDDGIIMWNRFQARIAKTRLDDVIGTLFTEPRYQITGNISPSQISRLRAKIADELRKKAPSLDFINKFLDDISGKKDAERTGKKPVPKAAGKQYEQARIGGKPLMEWLRRPTFDFSDKTLNKSDFQLRLIDAVLERAHKERTSKQKARQ